jgi:bifunctional non-homologous end joining protein LigD
MSGKSASSGKPKGTSTGRPKGTPARASKAKPKAKGTAQETSERRGSLREYHGKRHADRTPEPMGGRAPEGGASRFVIQKHAATSLHYDLRLEADDVLKSWAVPKGPSTDPRAKRLAMRTEDHPLDYLDFEGAIPAGEYGGGQVIVWDTGTYRNLTERRGAAVPAAEAVDHGHIKFWLDGERLHGGFALTRTGGDDGRERWILIKLADEGADTRRDPVRTKTASVRSGRTIEEIAQEGEAESGPGESG